MSVRPQIEIKEVEPGTRKAFWREAIVAWADSGLAQVEFCHLRGLELDTFRRYRTRLTRPAKRTGRSHRALVPSTRLPAVREAVPEFVEVQLPKVSSGLRLGSVDMLSCESLILRTHWVMVVMDQFTRRIIRFAVQAASTVQPSAACSTRFWHTRILVRVTSAPTMIHSSYFIAGKPISRILE